MLRFGVGDCKLVIVVSELTLPPEKPKDFAATLRFA
jgi:hypothetical protein